MTPEQLLASYLKILSISVKNQEIEASDEMVIAVPAYFSNCERQAFLDAAEIAGIKCPRLINDSTALALTYEYQKKNELSVGQ